MVGELAKIAYHNYLFPKDAYTLVDLAVHENGGYDEYYLVLEQPFVTPLTDGRGNIVPPTDDQIFAALHDPVGDCFVTGFCEARCSLRSGSESINHRSLSPPFIAEAIMREDIAAAVRSIRKAEAMARRAEKDGLEPDSALLAEIARSKAELLAKIRAERWK